jgi:hypothetical protein
MPRPASDRHRNLIDALVRLAKIAPGLDEFVNDRRPDTSWANISAELSRHDIQISDQALINWYGTDPQ